MVKKGIFKIATYFIDLPFLFLIYINGSLGIRTLIPMFQHCKNVICNIIGSYKYSVPKEKCHYH